MRAIDMRRASPPRPRSRQQHLRRMPLRFATLGLPAALAICACNAEIDPFQNTDLAFSIYGHLDPARDTQWVRVALLRPLRINTSDPIDATVVVEDIETGRGGFAGRDRGPVGPYRRVLISTTPHPPRKP